MTMVVNYDDVLGQLRDAGLIVDALEIGTPKPRRVKIEGEREKKGWYWLHEFPLDDGRTAIIGSFGAWSCNDNNAQKVKLRDIRLSDDQTRAMKVRLAEDRKRAEAARKREIERAAWRAAKAWASKCTPIDSPSACEYLVKRGIQPHGARMTAGGTLVVPMQDASGQVWGLQFIGPAVRKKLKDADKQYWPFGMSQTGRFFMIGKPGGVILICEGFVTGAALHEETGHCTVVAFDANNLRPVAEAIHKRYRTARLLICADDDFATRGNPGVMAASAAALVVGGAWVAPRFPDDDPMRVDMAAAAIDPEAKDYKQQVEALRRGRKKLTDFDDLRATSAPHTVRIQIEAAIDQQGWAVGEPVRETAPIEAGGSASLKPITSVHELFDRFAIIYGHNKSLFDFQERMLLPIEDMKNACSGRETWRAWMESHDKKIVRIKNVGFDPGGHDPDITCNLWGGWPTQQKQGDCDLLLGLLEYLCQGEGNHRDIYQWILNWLAYPLQHAGAKMKTAIVVHGPQRVGKNFFFESIMEIYGEYGQVIDQDALEDKYNDCFSRKLFLIADEVIARQELYHVKNKLKGMITGRRIRINPKNVKSYWETNHCNLVFLSNETQPLILERDDGRHVVLWTPPKLGIELYKDIEQEVANGGIPALYHFLKERELGDFNEYTPPPMTEAKRDLMGLSMDSTERFGLEWVAGKIEHIPKVPTKSTGLYALYREWTNRLGYSRAAPQPKFMAEICKRVGAVVKQAHYKNGATQPRVASFVFPPAIQPPVDESQQDWLSRSVVEFDAGLENWRADHDGPIHGGRSHDG